LVVVLLVVALISTVGWAISARRPDPAPTAAPAAAVQDTIPPHQHGGTAQNTPPIAPRDGLVAMTVPRLPRTAVNFAWRPEHLLVAAGQKLTVKVANADYMQHNFTFKAARVAENLPVDKTTTIELTAPTKPGLYRFFCKYHLQMMEGAVTVR
jgi:plastocyanin